MLKMVQTTKVDWGIICFEASRFKVQFTHEYGRQKEPRKWKHYNSLHGLRRICSEEIESTMESLKLHGRAIASIQGAIHYMNVNDYNITSLFPSWEKFIDDTWSMHRWVLDAFVDDLTIPWGLMMTYAEEIWFNWWKISWLIDNRRWVQH